MDGHAQLCVRFVVLAHERTIGHEGCATCDTCQNKHKQNSSVVCMARGNAAVASGIRGMAGRWTPEKVRMHTQNTLLIPLASTLSASVSCFLSLFTYCSVYVSVLVDTCTRKHPHAGVHVCACVCVHVCVCVCACVCVSARV